MDKMSGIGKIFKALKGCSNDLEKMLAKRSSKDVAQCYETMVKLAVYGYNDIGQRFLLNSDSSSVETAIIVEAVQYTGKNGRYLAKWSCNSVVESPVLEPTADNVSGAYVQLKLDTSGVGMWVVKFRDEFYICSDEEFAKHYSMTDKIAEAL